MKQVQALIVERNILAVGYYHYRLLAPEIADLAKPGQFVEIKPGTGESLDPLLARPISLYRIDRAAGIIELIFKTVGRGTGQLADKTKGNLMTVFGPVGNGFTVPATAKRLALIAGGIGMPPLFGLAETLVDQTATLFYGGRSSGDLLELGRWEQLGIPLRLATDDGSIGLSGVVTTAYASELTAANFDYLVACGPKPMLRAVQQLAKAQGISGALSLESYMACGVGACLGCVCRTKQGYQRVCVDGPVFAVDEVNFDE